MKNKRIITLFIIIIVIVITTNIQFYISNNNSNSLFNLEALATSETDFWNQMELVTYQCDDGIHSEQTCENSAFESNCTPKEETLCPPGSGTDKDEDQDEKWNMDEYTCYDGNAHAWIQGINPRYGTFCIYCNKCFRIKNKIH